MNAVTLTIANDCLLSGAPGQLLDALKNKLTLANPKYRDAVRYGRWVGKKLAKELHFYRAAGEALRFPRGFANQAVLLCRANGFEAHIIDKRHLCPSVELRFQGSLRPYQDSAVQEIIARDFGVLEAATGSGKTVMAAAVIAARRQPALVLVHTRELLHQWRQRIHTFLGVEPGLIGDGNRAIDTVTIGLIHSVRKHLAELPPRFGHIVVDEAHRTPSSMFTEIIREFDCRYMLGLTATPFRRDGLTELIAWHVGDLVHRVSSRELDDHGAVLKPTIIERSTNFTFRYRNNYQELMQALTANAERNTLIADDIAGEIRALGTILVVSDRVAHCQAISRLLEKRGIEAVLLTGRIPGEQRLDIVERVRKGEVRVLVATLQLIGEGFDCPGLTTLFLCTPIKFEGRLTQVIGRILRPAAGKQPKVYDYIDPVGVLRASARARRRTYDLAMGHGES